MGSFAPAQVPNSFAIDMRPCAHVSCGTKPTPMTNQSLDQQTITVVAALAAALCKQPDIDGQKLRMDFLDALEGLAKSPDQVNSLGKDMAALMEAVLRARSTGID